MDELFTLLFSLVILLSQADCPRTRPYPFFLNPHFTPDSVALQQNEVNEAATLLFTTFLLGKGM